MSFRQNRSPRFPNFLDYIASVPSVTTQAASSVASTTATGNGTLVNTGGAPITAMGFVWGTSPNPTLANNVVTVTTVSPGAFTGNMTGLPSSTLVYYDSYATNDLGTSYGGDQNFTTSGAVAAASGSTLLLMGVG